MTTARDVLHYYQKKIDRNINDEKVIIDSIFKITKLPVTAEVLQDTGIYNVMHTLSLKGGNVGAKALHLFNKWRLLMTIAMKDKESPIKSPVEQPRIEERSVSASNHTSRSSAESNASHCSRDNNNSGRSMKYSDPSQFGRRELYDSERDARCSGSSADFNGLNNNNRDSYHLYEDGSFNPHLSIDNSGSDEASDQNGGTKSRILEPYSIEMREGMFRVVKIKSNNSVPPSVLRARQLYHKDFLKKSAPYKKERDKSEGSSSGKHERSPGKNYSQQCNGERLKRKGESSTNGSAERHVSGSDKRPKASSDGKHSAFMSKSDGRDASPSFSGGRSESRGVDKKRLERKSTPESVPDKLKLKAVKEERSSNVSKSSNADNLQANCDRKPMKIMDSPDDSAMKFITSKKERRAVYSGKKSVTPVPTLKEFCIRSLKKNVDSVKCTRTVPYNVLKPFLEHLSPMQLYKLEEQNRYLLRETDELWKQHCNRDYRGQVPTKNENWRSIYYRAHKEQDRKLKTITANISASSMKVRPDRQTKITLVDSPHDPQRKRMKRSNSPVFPPSSSSPSLSSKLSPHVSLKASPNVGSKSSPCVSSKSVSPNVTLKVESSKSSKESKPHPKQPKKADAPLMSKLKKSMGLAYRSK